MKRIDVQSPARLRAPERERAPGGDPPGPSPARDAPRASAAPYPPAARCRSTLGDGGLNFRVRNGIGCSPASMAALARGAPRALRPPRRRQRHPGGRTARRGRGPGARDTQEAMRRARPVSSARLSGSPRLQLRPINLVVYEGPYRREGSSRRRLPA